MASTYTANQGIEKMDTGDQSGTWGGTVNTNMDIIDRAISGVVSITLTGSTTTLTTTDGTLTDGMYRVLVLGDGGDLGSDNTLTISPNDQDKAYLVYNNLSANRSAIFTQGTGANATVQNGETAWIYADGAGSGAAVRTAVSSVKITDQDGDTQIQVEEGGDDDDTIRFDIAGAEDFTMTANTFNVLSGSTLNVNSGATIANNGTATGFGGSATSAKTAAYTVIAADDGKTILCSAASADYAVALTAAGTLGDGFSVTIKKSDATKFMITINPDGTETIDDLLDLKLRNEHSEATLICDGSNWHLISHENVAYEYNMIENANMQIHQYGHVTATGLGGSTAHFTDRWQLSAIGSASARWTYSKETNGGVQGRSAWTKFLNTTAQASAGSGDAQYIYQNTLGNNGIDAGFIGSDGFFENGVYYLDMIVALATPDAPYTVTLAFHTLDGSTRQYGTTVSILADATWQRVGISIPEDGTARFDAGTGASRYISVGLYAGSGQVMTDATWESNANESFVSGSENLAGATGNYIGITNVKFQPGQIATPFIPRLYEEELAICHFYYYKWFSDAAATSMGVAVVENSTRWVIQLDFPQTMRINAGTVTMNNPTSFKINTESTTNGAASGLNESYATRSTVGLQLADSGLTASECGRWGLSDANGSLTINCEI
jgi:hypothetical protein